MSDERVLTIYRGSWRRGGDSEKMMDLHGATVLLNERGMMCCLGFDALACGLMRDDIRFHNQPDDIPADTLSSYPEYVDSARFTPEDAVYDESGLDIGSRLSNSDLIGMAIGINDDDNITDEERERLLAPVLRDLGWDRVEFVDGEMPREAR